MATRPVAASDQIPAGRITMCAPRIPHEFRLAALRERTGHDLELRGDEGGFFIFDWSVGDAMSEGRTREEALDLAEEHF